ncbi:unnamed protein product [Rodentolepis nana]|uniref:FPL domain-containing protein n=1 Tax=Rodentolepis nana TaxID=102285 RepID=A0A0R3TYQ5_RODNA|nr:unnamed protein product [Rodentolepis nana]
MFSRSKNSGLQNSKKLHSVEYLKYLYNVLLKNYDSSDCRVDDVVESLRLFSEIIVWGDQNDGSIMDYLNHRKKDRRICTQLLQSLNILFENLTNNYLLSQNHTNNIILHEFDFSDEEIVGYYIAFLKSLSFRVNEDTIHFFYDETTSNFPLYQKALELFDHAENMVRIAVRTITLNIFKARIEDLVAETGDHLHYIDDIFALGVVDLTNVLCLVLLRRLFLPVYVYSLNKRHHQKVSLSMLFYGLGND